VSTQAKTFLTAEQYLLVAQDRLHVDLYTRQPDGTWQLREASRPEDSVELQSIGCRLLLSDVYEKANLPAG
jgi:Uma2 family endonuclease